MFFDININYTSLQRKLIYLFNILFPPQRAIHFFQTTKLQKQSFNSKPANNDTWLIAMIQLRNSIITLSTLTNQTIPPTNTTNNNSPDSLLYHVVVHHPKSKISVHGHTHETETKSDISTTWGSVRILPEPGAESSQTLEHCEERAGLAGSIVWGAFSKSSSATPGHGCLTDRGVGGGEKGLWCEELELGVVEIEMRIAGGESRALTLP